MTRPLRSWHRDAGIVVVGSGAAGICAALTAAATGASVLVVTKDLTGGASPLAQGGLAAAIGPGDSTDAHARDTVSAGAGLCEPDVVAALAAASPAAIDWLAACGTRLERRSLRLEGGHSRRRIVHSGDDATGAEVHRALLEALLASGIEILDRCVALSLEPSGLTAATIGPGGVLDPGEISARAVILAAGGLGQAFATTSNPPGATGDAMALAARAGAVLRDPEFVQFHPTVLWREGWPGNQRPLITEALRGAGAVLRDLGGKPVMAGQDPRGDLAPRDVVAARIHEVISSGDGPGHVWLDATGLGRGVLEDGFPTVTAACRKQGVDPVAEFIPVAPGAHYACGGIRADLDGHTSVPGLYAIGEAASTGVHGANRLASNSLVEAVITGRRAGQAASRTGTALEPASASEAAAAAASAEMDGTFIRSGAYQGHIHPDARAVLAEAMSRYAGVMRDRDGLERLTTIIEGAARRESTGAVATGEARDEAPVRTLAEVEAANLRDVSALIAAGALRRTESRGAHRRSDAPDPEPGTPGRHTLARVSRERGHAGHITMTWEDIHDTGH